MTELNLAYLAVYICGIVIAFSAMLLNGLFLIALVKNTSLHTPSNAVLACLCFSDLLVGVSTLPIWVTLVIASLTPSVDESKLTWLRTFGSMGGALANLSFCFITLVNIDRYTAILHPFSYVEHATCKLWTIRSLSVGAIFLILMTVTHFIDKEYNIGAQFIFNSICYCTAAVIIIFCNWKICKVIQRQTRSIASISRQSGERQRCYQCNIRRYKLVVLLVLVLTLCKIPYIAYFLYAKFHKPDPVTGSLGLCSDFGMILNSVLNPLIYYIRTSSFRKAMKEVLCCRWMSVAS